jgi:hypothetical protein
MMIMSVFAIKTDRQLCNPWVINTIDYSTLPMYDHVICRGLYNITTMNLGPAGPDLPCCRIVEYWLDPTLSFVYWFLHL